jgi:hypothetical protein
MSTKRLSASLAGGVLLGAAGMLAACSGDDSKPPVASSFHYVETATGNIDGDPIEERGEGWYKAPDSAHIVTNVNYSALGLENIVIDSQVWERRESGWRAATTDVACFNALDKIDLILRYGGHHHDSSETSDGPMMGGEPTRRYTWESEDVGRNAIIATERNLVDTPQNAEVLARTKEIFSELTGTTEATVGKETGRVYSLVEILDGPKMSRRQETIVDQHDEPMEIQPPPNVPPPAEDPNASSCPEPPGDFPWIPAAIAAVLLPLLFLGGSAFLWPRRL